MKIVIGLLTGILLFYLVSFGLMSKDSKRARETGLVNGTLRQCPGTPNCVVSEYNVKDSYIEPLAFSGEPVAAWKNVKDAVAELGGRLEKDDGGYLWATFRSSFWGFVDDLELRMDGPGKVIQVRSASRVGKGDMGVNRKRVEKLRELFNTKMSKGR